MKEIDLKRLLIFSVDPRVAADLKSFFELEGFEVLTARDEQEILAIVAADAVDVVLMDPGCRGQTGIELARRLRSESSVGIILLSHSEQNLPLAEGLEVGADDAMLDEVTGNPARLRELRARVLSVLRRIQPHQRSVSLDDYNEFSFGDVLQFDGWQFDLARRRLISPQNAEISLTSAEFELLSILVRNVGQAVSRDELMRLTRERDWEIHDRSIDAQVTRLRRKIEADSRNPALIKTVRGQGYLFAAPVKWQ